MLLLKACPVHLPVPWPATQAVCPQSRLARPPPAPCRYELNTRDAYDKVPWAGWQKFDENYIAYQQVGPGELLGSGAWQEAGTWLKGGMV